MSKEGKKLVINELEFELSLADPALSVISLASGEVTLTSCSFKRASSSSLHSNDGELTKSIINMKGGS